MLAILLWACRSQAPADSAQPPATAIRHYTVRAEVLALPPKPGGELVIRHEAIPEFTDSSGAAVGMKSMTMPFPVAPGLSLAGLAPGDKIEILFSIDWTRGRYLVERLRKLPAGTALRLGATP